MIDKLFCTLNINGPDHPTGVLIEVTDGDKVLAQLRQDGTLQILSSLKIEFVERLLSVQKPIGEGGIILKCPDKKSVEVNYDHSDDPTIVQSG